MRKSLRASVFVLALCCPALAGDISNPSVVQPPQGLTAEAPAADGDMQNGSADGLTDMVLTVLGSVLALF